MGGICYQDHKRNLLEKIIHQFRIGDEWQLSTNLKPKEHIYGLGERAVGLTFVQVLISWNTDAEGSYSHGRDPLYIGTPIDLSITKAGNYLIF